MVAPEVVLPPVDVFCPSCGGEPLLTPSEVESVEHRLRATGYTRVEIRLRCVACDERWRHGVPIGEYELDDADDLRCHSCRHDPSLSGEQWYLVHRVEIDPEWDDAADIGLHLKCPRCYLFTKAGRDADRNGLALVGYPQSTGSVIEADQPYGYDPEVRLA